MTYTHHIISNMTRRTPEVIEHPYIHCLSIDHNIFTDNPDFIGDSRGFTECTIMLPKHIIGIIIGHKGYNIKRMMKKYNMSKFRSRNLNN